MKSERRHELKQNTLARGLETLPDVGRRHGTKVLVVVMIGLLLALLIRSRVTSAREAADSAAYSLNHGRELIDQMREAGDLVVTGRIPSTQLVTISQNVAKGVETAAQQVLDSTDDPRLMAEARLVRGDLNWHLANLPEAPGATTRPDLALPKTDDQLLQAAAESYQAVLETPSAPRESLITARLSLAAVAENRRQWDQARQHYQNVVDDSAAPKPLRDVAVEALNRLQTIQKPPLIAPPSTNPFADLELGGVESPATTRGATTQSTTGPTTSTQPGATQPGAPATTGAATTPTSPAAEGAKPQAAPAPSPENPNPAKNPG